MSDYTKITDFTTKDSTNALIEGVDFDSEFTAVATMSSTKSDKAVPATANSVAGLNSVGNLYDTTIEVADLSAAISKVLESGMMLPYGGASAPAGYLDCDGTSHATASYPDLFAVIAYDFGGSGANFNVPDLRGRVPAGQDNIGGTSANVVTDASADSMGGELGAETHALSLGEGPAHTHTGTTSTTGGHAHTGGSNYNGDQSTGGGSNSGGASSTGNSGNHAHTFTSDSTGSGTAHNNMQPSLFMNYIIKT